MLNLEQHMGRCSPVAVPGRLILALAGWTVSAPAQDALPDKSGYHLFHPVPREWMRPLSADRPDLTESPFTVDAGRVQVEMDFVNVQLDHDRSGGGDVRSEVWAFAPINGKLGVRNNLDVQFVFEPWVRSRIQDRDAQTTESASGFGNVQTRVKLNLWGNDGGPTALAVMPFVKWPLPQDDLRNGRIEGGVILPFAIELPHGWELGLMTELDFEYNAARNDYDAVFVNSAALARHMAGALAGYAEFFSAVSTTGADGWIGLVGVGFTWALSDDAQLDAGCNFGVTGAAPDFNPFVGMTWRF
jgi:hypothetical protein